MKGTAPTAIRLTQELKDKLTAIAGAMQLSEAEVIRYLIREKHAVVFSGREYMPGKDY